MKYLIFPGILWCLCILFSIPAAIHISYIIALLFSLSFSSLGLLSSTACHKIACPACLFYQLLCIFWPDLRYFLPMSVYLLLHFTYDKPQKLFYVTWLLPLLFVLPDIRMTVTLLLLCLLALLLAYSADHLEGMARRFYAFQDDSRQKSRLLEQKNHLLIEHRDYQVQLATLAERNRIAREIHDNVGHLLTRSLLQVTALEITNPQIQQPLAAVKDTLSSAMDSIRSSVHNLRDQSLDLALEIQELIDHFTFCPVTLRYEAVLRDPALHYCFLSIIKEALSNIARHSHASSAQISVLEHPSFYQLIIEDNGNTDSSYNSGSGMGLHNIRERVESLHGILHITTKQGFRLFISIPNPQGGDPNEAYHH